MTIFEAEPVHRVSEFCATHMHKKTRNLYEVMARGHDCTNGTDPRPVVIYRDSAGSWWTRYAPEFDDGRFEKL